MKKKSLGRLALLGISLGSLCISGYNYSAERNMPPDMQAFYEQLSPNGQKKFLQLDDEHRKMAMQISRSGSCHAEQGCHGSREQSVDQQYNHQLQQRRQMNQQMNPK